MSESMSGLHKKLEFF